MPYFTSQRTVGLGRSTAHHDRDAWQWSAGYSSDWADWNAWGAEEAWGWDWPETHSYSSKGTGKNKGKQSSDAHGADKGKGSKGGKKGKDGSGKGKSSDAHGEKEASKIIVANKGLKDEDLEKFCDEQREKNSEGADQLDLAFNLLVGGSGFNYLQDFCMDLANLSIVKLHKNMLSDAAAPFLAKMCSGGCRWLRELHLSHNLITRTGAEEIVTAACKARTAPESTDDEKARAAPESADDEEADGDGEEKESKVLPLWLRLEYNEISEPQELVDEWKSRKLCIVAYTKGPSRHNLPPGVHLPFFFGQGKPSSYVHSSEAASKEKTNTEQKTERSKGTKTNDSGKKPAQLKWKPKVKPENEEGPKAADSEAKAESNEEAKEAVVADEVEKGEESADKPVDEPNTSDDKKEEVAADDGKDKKEKRTGKKGQRRSADDDADATVFSSGEESAGSN